jgi:sterol desaturase/sphingolipid hydroxylase (fatty acid hydroxylase superfamily)
LHTHSRKQFTPFYFYTVVAGGLVVVAAISEARSIIGIVVLLLCGILSWGFVEYTLHRYVLHDEAPTKRSPSSALAEHAAHHDDPRAVGHLFVSVRASAPVALCYCLLAWAVMGSWQAMAYLFIGVVSGYFSYEWLHYQAHHGASRWRLLRYLKKYHLLHHHQTPDLRFGVTSPIVDYLFGTYQPVGKRAAPPTEQTVSIRRRGVGVVKKQLSDL